jgi:hypothetical protein
MKTSLRNLAVSLLVSGTLIFSSCKKDTPPTTTAASASYDTYSSLQSFYAKNGVPTQSFTVNGTTGGSFTTPQGTKVTIPANAFMDQSYTSVTGTVNIQFKDIYTKSDMLLSNVTPICYTGSPLKSGGEFFIKATSGGKGVYLVAAIQIQQPFNGWPADNKMNPFTRKDSISLFLPNWSPNDSAGSVVCDSSLSNYLFSLYQFSSPVDSGTWCNSDNPTYFSAYPQSNFTIQTTDSVSYNTSVFLLFNGLNSMVHVYYSNTTSGLSTFNYAYAPVGLQCTVVAVEIMPNGQFRAAFVPKVTITTNGTINFTATPTTTANFKAQLSTYNH